jgi:beta-glucanase (GH16 family)
VAPIEQSGDQSGEQSGTVAGGDTNGNGNENTIGASFSSHTTAGFAGEVLDDGSVRVTWTADASARGYNIYRGGDFVTSVFEDEWTDEDTTDGSFYYEIEAFDFADNLTRIATGLTVDVAGSGRENPNAAVTAGVNLDEYELVFADEFNGDSLDFSKWSTSYVWGTDIIINGEEQFYVDTKNDPDFGFDPFTFDGENLTINSIRTPDALREKAIGQPYLSGLITSRDSFNFTYGYAEARAKTPFGKGFWSAFWLLNTVYDRGDEPEIDIMEHIGDDQDVMYHTYHYYDHFEDSEELHSTPSVPVVGIDFTADFHTFAVDWRPGTLIFYVDGIETYRLDDPRVSSVDMYVLANTAVGGWWPGSPDETTQFPAEYQLDYIRVYQKVGPYDDPPLFSDSVSRVPAADSLIGTSPSRRPSFAAWPEGYPGRTSTAN